MESYNKKKEYFHHMVISSVPSNHFYSLKKSLKYLQIKNYHKD